MVPQLRKSFNQHFEPSRHEALIDEFEKEYNHRPIFNIAETPIFVPKALKHSLFEACELITDVIAAPDFKEKSEKALLAGQVVPNETDHTTFLQMDFGVCLDANGNYLPQLIEIQGFPSLYFYQVELAYKYRKYHDIPQGYDHLFSGMTKENYISKLREVIVGDTDPKNVVLLEVEPTKQVTQIDFWVCQKHLGIKVLCVSDVKKEGKKLYYLENGEKIYIHKIFNRVIFDELIKRDDLPRDFFFTEGADVEWIGHPNWFFRISKHTLPFLKNKYVPDSTFLNDINEYPEDLENYVLKPLYSFAGSGVIINLNKHDLESIKDPENYILQRKVAYAPVIETLDVNAKCEIRMLMIWEKNAERPHIINNLVRLSKAEMVGVRYNKGKTWVGGSIGFFEEG